MSQEAIDRPHITPLRVYFTVAGGLLALTLITVYASQVDLGDWNVVVALSIAAAKATLVALFFMHLFYDNKLYSIVFSAGILFLTIFIILTMIDTETRDSIYPETATALKPSAIIYDANGVPILAVGAESHTDKKDYAMEAWLEKFSGEAESTARSRWLYNQYCTVCHGKTGEGDGFNAFNLDPKPKSFADSTLLNKFTSRYLSDVIALGGESVGLSNMMPPYGRNLSEVEVSEVALYVRRLQIQATSNAKTP